MNSQVNSSRKMERIIRFIAGSFVLISLALGTWVNHYWYLFTAFVGANLLQSGITNWCLMEDILRKFGIEAHAPETPTAGVHRSR